MTAPRQRTNAARAAAFGSSALVLLIACLGSACRPSPSDPRPNLVLIVIDNLRADHLGAYGYPRPTSPTIDRLAARSVVFENAVATSSWTKPSVASLFTSRHPSEHNAVSFTQHLAPDLPTLAEALHDAGYRTVGVTANFVHVNERWGFARGFDSWNSFSVEVEDEAFVLWRYEHQPGEFVPLRAPNASEVNREVLERLDAADDRPVFLYVHYMEPHAPYTPLAKHLRAIAGTARPEAGAFATNDLLVRIARGEVTVSAAERQWLIDLYDAEIAGVDEAIGELFAELRDRDVLPNGVVALVSDHGEEFAEHGGWFHAMTLYRESLAVPLVLRDWRSDAPGERVAEAVDLADVPTTLLALAGVAKLPGMHGRDLLATRPLPPRDLVAELHADPKLEERIGPRTHRFALTRWPWKTIVDRDHSRSLYRADRDPAELAPVTEPGEIPTAVREAVDALTQALDTPSPAPAEPLDAEALEGLRALGYAE